MTTTIRKLQEEQIVKLVKDIISGQIRTYSKEYIDLVTDVSKGILTEVMNSFGYNLDSDLKIDRDTLMSIATIPFIMKVLDGMIRKKEVQVLLMDPQQVTSFNRDIRTKLTIYAAGSFEVFNVKELEK